MTAAPNDAHPLVSIMTPVYNGERYLAQAIDSVLAQTYPHWELIVVDDGSADDSAAIAAACPDPRLRLIRQSNGGEAVARNTALAHLRGDLLAFVDADDRFLPDHLALTVEYLTAHPEMDGVYTDGHHIDPNGRRLQTLSSRRRGPFHGDLFEPLVRASDVFGPPLCVVLRSAAVRHSGVDFDPQIVIGPDWDFFTRFSQHARFGYLDECTCEYRIHQTNISVQTGLERRRGYLARCREKAIRLARFNDCSEETRAAVFYDLLVTLLAGKPERQNEVLGWPQFAALRPPSRARLLRRMACEAALAGQPPAVIAAWLQDARRLHPADRAAGLLLAAHRLHPALLRLLLRLRRGEAAEEGGPFADMEG